MGGSRRRSRAGGRTTRSSALPTGPRQVEYRESLYVGYRYYDSVGADVLFPFGHGLGYTTFGYSGLELGPVRVSTVKTCT